MSLLYLTGSRLIKTNSEYSDYDFYAFITPSKVDYVLRNNDKGKVYKGFGFEVKCFNISHLFNLLLKTNPNVIEMFFAKPVYNKPIYYPLVNYLYANRELLPYINRKHFVASSAGMIKSDINRLKPDKTFNGSGSFGKNIFNLIKAYNYGHAVATHHNLEELVFSNNVYLDIKNLNKYSQKVIDGVNPVAKYNTLSHSMLIR